MKKLLILLVVLSMAMALFAQGADEAADEAVEFTFATEAKWAGVTGLEENGEYGDWEKAMAEIFMENNPNVTINVEIWPTSGSEATAKMNTAIASKTYPDVYKSNPLRAISHAYTGLLAPVDDYVTDPEDILSGTWKSAEIDGMHYYFPWSLQAQGMLVNKDLFDQAGVALPDNEYAYWTEDEFFDALSTVVEKTGIDGTAINAGAASGDFAWRAWYWAFGAQFVSDDGREIIIDSPEGRAAAQYIDKLTKNGLVVPGSAGYSAGDIVNKYFYNQQVAAIPAVSVWYGRAVNRFQTGELDKFNIAFIMQPGAEKMAYSLTQCFFLFNPSDGKQATLDAAGKFGDWMTSGEPASHVKYASLFPTRSSLSELYADSEDPNIAMQQKILEYVIPIDAELKPGYLAAREAWQKVNQAYFTGEISADMLTQQYVEKSQPAIDDAWADIE